MRLLHEQIDRAFDFLEAATADRLAEKHMVVEVVAVRIELEQALAQDEILSARPDLRNRVEGRPDDLIHPGDARPDLRRLVIGVYADAREDVREFLHVLLRVAGVDAERVQLHEFARVVLVDLVRAVLRVVEILQHGRMLERGKHEIAEMPERVGANRAIGVVAREKLHVALLREHVEVVEPEPDHLLLELVGRIDRTQQLTSCRLIRELVAEFVARLARVLLLPVVAESVDALLLGDLLDDELRDRCVLDFERVDLRLDRVGQLVIAAGQLLVEETAPTQLAEALHRRAVEAVGHALEPERIVAAQRRVVGRADDWRHEQHRPARIRDPPRPTGLSQSIGRVACEHPSPSSVSRQNGVFAGISTNEAKKG